MTINYSILILNINNKPLQLPVLSCFYNMLGCVRTSALIPHGLRRSRPVNTLVLFWLTENIKGKGKAIPVQVWTDPVGSRRLRFPDFQTIGT
jgi:hypothetical protein